MNSLLHPHLFGESARVFADEVNALANGELHIEVHDQLVLDVDAFEALHSGLVDAVWGSPGHHHREEPALILFGGFPFGPDPDEFSAWMKEGEGASALDEIYSHHGLRSIYCGVLPEEAGGWFRFPINTTHDLNGLAMRSFGYGAQTLRNLGVTTYELPASDIRPAFENGVIDAAEFAMPSIDSLLGFPEYAPYLYIPGWQQPSTALELLVLEKTWLALSESIRGSIERACDEALRWTRDIAVQHQDNAIADFRARGVKVLEWPPQLLDALELSWTQVIKAETAADPRVAMAWKSYLDFKGDGAQSSGR
ncbi:TRAP transporter substrate-binding protein [Granulosicoccus sp. 3-233]|uniref:TRAP transporter substrate-binding protein n=1 Tax=Granulosicoccus sp. 3-233 TaxID=3417969 RepID=UPI003D329AC3